MRSRDEVLRELLQCAASWEPDVKLIGNVSAAEIVAHCDGELKAQRGETPSSSRIEDAQAVAWCEKIATVNAAYEEAKIGNSDQAITDAEYDRYETLLAFQHWWEATGRASAAPVAAVVSDAEAVAWLLWDADGVVDSTFDKATAEQWAREASQLMVVRPLVFGDEAPVAAVLDVDGLRVGEHMVREMLRKIAEYEAHDAAPVAAVVSEAEVDAFHKRFMSEMFALCQPDKGDIFAFIDDQKDAMRKALTAARGGA